MKTEIFTTHPVALAIISGSAPVNAQMAAAKGVLPLPQTDLLEVLVNLALGADAGLSAAALETLSSQNRDDLLLAVSAAEIAPSVLNFIARSGASFDRVIHEAVVTNAKTPDEAVAALAAGATSGELLDTMMLNQQRLIRTPAILDALLANPHRSAETERRAREMRREFFEKTRGTEQIAAELRARGNVAGAEFLEQAAFAENLSTEPSENGLSVDDAWLIAQHIEVPDEEVDDSWLSFDLIEQLYEENDEQRRALAEKIISESVLDGEAAPERIALIRRVMLMNIKDRVKLAMKGDREARGILIRDSNKIVASAVLANSRITEQEVEKIAAMRTVPDEVLRNIGINRTWARNYSISHNLVRNPRTPMPIAFNILPRIQTKDMQAISKNRNVGEAIRKQAFRLLTGRKA